MADGLKLPVWPVKNCQMSIDFIRKITDFDTFTKIAFWDLGKFIIAKGFEKLPKVQYITQSGHTENYPDSIKTLNE